MTFYFYSENPSDIEGNAFGEENSDLFIYVPATALGAYKSQWEYYTSRIFPIPEFR